MVTNASFIKMLLCIVLLALTAGWQTTRASTSANTQTAVSPFAVGDEIQVKRQEATKLGSNKLEVSEPQVWPEGEAAAFESLEATLIVAGNIWWKYRFGDYVVKAVGRERSKFDSKSDVTTLKRDYDVAAPTGAKAKIKRERRDFWSTVEYIDPSLGDVLVDGATESVWGWSLLDYEPDPNLFKYVVSSTITLADAPGEAWQLELEELPVPKEIWLGSQFEWGYGTLTNGARMLELVLHGAAPSSEEECLQMSQTWDRHQSKKCRVWITEIKEDGELLAWKGAQGCSGGQNHGNEYCFRVGLDVNTKLLLVAMFASMIP